MDRLLKPQEVADKLRLHQGTVLHMLQRGKLSGIKIGTRGDWRIRETVFDEYLKNAEHIVSK